MFGEEEQKKKKRKTISKTEWEAVKSTYKNRCVICGKTEKEVGQLEKAHLKAHSKGGTAVVPMCPNCHTRYDKGLLTAKERKKLGLDKESYKRVMPKKKKKTKKKDEHIFGW